MAGGVSGLSGRHWQCVAVTAAVWMSLLASGHPWCALVVTGGQ